MMAANKTRNGMEDFDREVLHRSHIDCATQVGEYSGKCSDEFSGEFRLKWRMNCLQLAVRLGIWIYGYMNIWM